MMTNRMKSTMNVNPSELLLIQMGEIAMTEWL
jgi:hypothetical protein